MKDLITEARELHAGWMAHESMHHGGGQGAKSDDGEMSRKFMFWFVDDFPELCDALEKAEERGQGCEHCRGWDKRCGANYCPMCGKRLEEHHEAD